MTLKGQSFFLRYNILSRVDKLKIKHNSTLNDFIKLRYLDLFKLLKTNSNNPKLQAMLSIYSVIK